MALYRYHVCFTVGAVVPWEAAVLFGNMIAEPPIVRDYLAKTGGTFLPIGKPALPERDWWDEGPIEARSKSYRDILQKRRHGLSAKALDELSKGKMPDLLTYKGPGPAGPGTRHEFYEIKPRSISGITKGMEKVAWLVKNYGSNGLPYSPGKYYPKAFYDTGIARLPLLAMDQQHEKDWDRSSKIIKKRRKLSKLNLYLEVRNSCDGTSSLGKGAGIGGVLLYRICIETESTEDKDNSVVIAEAREAVNAFVMSSVHREKPRPRVRIVTAVGRALELAALEKNGQEQNVFNYKDAPVKYPMIDVTMDKAPGTIRPMLGAIRDAMNTRRIGVPGDRFMLCCDEDFYNTVVVPVQPIHLIVYLKNTPMRWAGYARDRSGQGWIEAVNEASDIYNFGRAMALAGFKPLEDWVKQNPTEAVLIGVGVVVVSALAFWALPALAVELAAVEAATVGATSASMSSAFISAAAMSAPLMEEATALELAAAANASIDAALLSAAGTVGTAAIETEAVAIATSTALPAGALALTAEQALLRATASVVARRALAEILKTQGPKITALAIGTTVALVHQTAFAAPTSTRVKGGPVPSPESFTQAIGTRLSRMFILPVDQTPVPMWQGLDLPQKRTPGIGEKIDAAQFNSTAAKEVRAKGETKLECHYLGELVIT